MKATLVSDDDNRRYTVYVDVDGLRERIEHVLAIVRPTV